MTLYRFISFKSIWMLECWPLWSFVRIWNWWHHQSQNHHVCAGACVCVNIDQRSLTCFLALFHPCVTTKPNTTDLHTNQFDLRSFPSFFFAWKKSNTLINGKIRWWIGDWPSNRWKFRIWSGCVRFQPENSSNHSNKIRHKLTTVAIQWFWFAKWRQNI